MKFLAGFLVVWTIVGVGVSMLIGDFTFGEWLAGFTGIVTYHICERIE